MTYKAPVVSRRGLLHGGAVLLGGASLPMGLPHSAFAADNPPLGNYPDGVSGSSVFVGICLPRTGTYAVPGEDELKGYELAIEQLNAGDPLIRQISPHTTKGVLGKQVKIRRRRFRRRSRTPRCRRSRGSSPRTRRS